VNGQICYESNFYSFCVHEISQLIAEFCIVLFPHLFQLKFQKFQKLKLFFLNLGSGSQMMLPVTLQLDMNCSFPSFISAFGRRPIRGERLVVQMRRPDDQDPYPVQRCRLLQQGRPPQPTEIEGRLLRVHRPKHRSPKGNQRLAKYQQLC
jgi:hypothetical protein